MVNFPTYNNNEYNHNHKVNFGNVWSDQTFNTIYKKVVEFPSKFRLLFDPISSFLSQTQKIKWRPVSPQVKKGQKVEQKIQKNVLFGQKVGQTLTWNFLDKKY